MFQSFMRSQKMISIKQDSFLSGASQALITFYVFTYYLAFYNYLHMLNCFTDPVYGTISLHCPAPTTTGVFFIEIKYREINLVSKVLEKLPCLITLLDCSRFVLSSSELSQD